MSRSRSFTTVNRFENSRHKNINVCPKIFKPISNIVLGSGMGFFTGKAIAGASATVAGISASFFIASCAIAGAGIVLLLAWAVRRCIQSSERGFFPSGRPAAPPRLSSDKQSHDSLVFARA